MRASTLLSLLGNFSIIYVFNFQRGIYYQERLRAYVYCRASLHKGRSPVGTSWVVVAGVLTGVDFIPLKLLRIFLFSYFSTGDLLSVTPKNIVFLPTLPFAQKKKNQKTRRRHEVEQ